jgi:hypothetical protein
VVSVELNDVAYRTMPRQYSVFRKTIFQSNKDDSCYTEKFLLLKVHTCCNNSVHFHKSLSKLMRRTKCNCLCHRVNQEAFGRNVEKHHYVTTTKTTGASSYIDIFTTSTVSQNSPPAHQSVYVLRYLQRKSSHNCLKRRSFRYRDPAKNKTLSE